VELRHVAAHGHAVELGVDIERLEPARDGDGIIEVRRRCNDIRFRRGDDTGVATE